jgi:hypothetical protein
MAQVLLGNTHPLDNGIPMDAPSITTVSPPADATHREVLLAIADPRDGLWQRHSSDQRPAWLESDDPALADFLATYLGCPVGRPDPSE